MSVLFVTVCSHADATVSFWNSTGQSAAVGVACAGELYFSASFSVAVILLLLRFGPRQYSSDEEEDEEEKDNDHAYQKSAENLEHGIDPELQPLRRPSVKTSRSMRARKHAALGGIV